MAYRGGRAGRPRREAGFTLIELMVTIAVLAITLALAVPGFTGLINAGRLVAESNELVASLQLARSEAIRRNAGVALCASSDGSTCSEASSGDWSYWVVRVVSDTSDSGLLRVYRVNPRLLVQSSAAISGNTTYPNTVVFSSDGLARAYGGALLAASIGVCVDTARPEQNQRRVSIAGGSRIKTVSETNTDCGEEIADE
ncbi:MAG: GspH/FimT family pseudopilin [Pseudomonas sp.]